MAIGRLSMKIGTVGKAGPHAAYIARVGPYAARLARAERLEATEAGNLPAWAQHDPLIFWQAADAFERKNGSTYREMEIALPRELDAAQRVAIVREWVKQEIGERHAYQWAIHTPTAADGGEQPHVHLMFSERQRDGIERDPEQYFKRYNAKAPEQGGARKGYGPSAGQTLTKAERAAELKELRTRWEAACNRALERAGIDTRIDMRSHAERGTSQEAERKQLPSQWRGQGRAQVIAFRQARAELIQARQALAQAIPDARAEVLHLEAERHRRAQTRQVDPAAALAEWLSAPPVPLRGSMEGIGRQTVLTTLCACQADNLLPAALLGEAEQTALRQAGWITLTGDLTPKGLGAVQLHQAKQAQQAQAAAALAAQQAEQQRAHAAERERQRQAAQEKQRQAEQEQERLDAQTAAGTLDGIRAPRRRADEWRQWRERVLTQAYGDQIEASELAKAWKVQRPRHGQPLLLIDHAKGQSIADHGDRIVPRGEDAWGQPLTDQTLRTALQLAQRKGWDHPGLDITGSAAFRERAARMATRMGLTVANADLQHIVMEERAEAGKQQAREAFERFKAEQTARQRAFSTQTVDNRPHAAPQPAPQQVPVKVPEKQANPPDPARAEALAFLGENPTERRKRWDALVQRVATPPQPTNALQDPQAVLAAWQASRTQRGLSNQDTAHVFDRCTRLGWTAAGLRTDWQRQVDALREEITDLERSGKRWIGSNRNAQQIAQLTQQRARTAQRGNAELDLARDWEAFKPQVLAQEHAQRLTAWQQDTERKQRIAPHVLPILEQDRQAAERAKAEKEAQKAQQAQQAERETPQPRPATPRRSKTPDRGMGMG